MKYFRWTLVLLAVAVAMGVLSAMFGVLGSVDAAPAAISKRPHVPYYTHLQIDDLEASAWYVLVDLSDKTNFPHVRTNAAVLKQLQYTGVLSEATHWDVYFGVMGEIGDASSYVEWFHRVCRVRNTQFDQRWTLPEHGLKLSLESDDTLQFVASREFTNTAAVTTTTQLTSPVTESGNVTTTAGNGDIIMYVEEVDDDGYFEHLSIGTSYDTE